jgi:hypothetical protein
MFEAVKGNFPWNGVKAVVLAFMYTLCTYMKLHVFKFRTPANAKLSKESMLNKAYSRTSLEANTLALFAYTMGLLAFCMDVRIYLKSNQTIIV